MQQSYRRTHIPKCDFKKTVLLFYRNHTSAWVFQQCTIHPKIMQKYQIIQRKFCNHEICIALNKRLMSCTLQRNVSLPHHIRRVVFFRLINIMQLLNCWSSSSCSSLHRQKLNLRKNGRNCFSQMFCKFHRNHLCWSVFLIYQQGTTLQLYTSSNLVGVFMICESKLFQDMMHDKLNKDILLVKL